MPRRRKHRKVVAPPGFKGYKPYGTTRTEKEHIELLYEEYESLKLADYDLMNHLDASKLMGISRPTFARIYESARRKVAKAMVETKEIKTVFGNAIMDDSWFICKDCNTRFTVPRTMQVGACGLCSSKNVHTIINE
ncbi:MAG: DUF134 domain-containing protein [Bacteroidales bacterium]|jgi:predicted DNA-binding protein (UPF0251 family)|nr:DUF134 domain-containing protein [Bacteroidales bacterium]